MEEWSRKLKLLHWMCIAHADGVSPLLCHDDDDDDGAGETFEGGSAFEGGFDTGGGNAPDGSTQETFEGGANFDSSPGGGSQETFEGGANFDSSPGGGSVEGGPGGGGSNESVNDFASLDNSPAQGYADYGSNVEQGLGGGAPAGGAPAGSAASQGTSSDFLSSSQGSNLPDPNVPDVPGREFNIAGLSAPPGKEDKEDKEVTSPTRDLNIYDQPMGPPNTKELEREFQREFEREFQREPQQEQRELPANAMPTGYNAPYGSQQLDINAFVGPSQKDQAQVAPTSTTIGLTPEQVAQSANPWDVGPTTAVNAFGVGPTANPFAGPANVWDLPAPTPAAPQREEQNPWDQQQTAFNTFGFNPTTPQDYNMPAAISGTPTGAPPPDQQVATGPNAVQTTGFIAPNPTTPVTQGPPLGPAVPTGKSDFISSRDPFGTQTQNPNIWDPNTFAPPVGMVNLPSTPAPPGWAPSSTTLQDWNTAQPFGPQAPTQAAPQVAQSPQGQQAAPTPDPTIFDARSISQQVPPNLFDLPPTQQQTPPSRASVIARSGQPEQQKEQFTREQLDILTNPNLLQPYAPPPPPPVATAPPPSRTVDIPPHDQYEWPAQAPGRDFKVDASGNLSFAPTAPPSAPPPDQQPGPAAITGAMPSGGVPLGDLPGGGFPPSQAGGGSGVVTLPPQRQQQLSAQRRKPTQTEQEKRAAIVEALMRRDLNAPGVSDFDRLRLQP